MNVSPFKGAEDFINAKGAIYSFADSLGFLYAMTILSAAIMVYLVVKAYLIKHS